MTDKQEKQLLFIVKKCVDGIIEKHKDWTTKQDIENYCRETYKEVEDKNISFEFFISIVFQEILLLPNFEELLLEDFPK